LTSSFRYFCGLITLDNRKLFINIKYRKQGGSSIDAPHSILLIWFLASHIKLLKSVDLRFVRAG
jgi:hypothetical protein